MANEATRVSSPSYSLNDIAKAPSAMQVLRTQTKKPEQRCSCSSSSTSVGVGRFNHPLCTFPSPSEVLAYENDTAASNSNYSKIDHLEHCNWIVPLARRSSKVHKASRRRIKVISLSKKLNDGKKQNQIFQEGRHIRIHSSQNNSREQDDDDLTSQGKVFDSGINSSGYLKSNQTLSDKYQPKLLEDITGHEIVIKAITNAIQKNKIAPLYLFYGPSGTGKTSTARILAMALNCESSSYMKPCWRCQGCSRSLYTMNLCSGNTITYRFKRIRKLLQSMPSTRATPRFQVFIIEDCDSINPEAWDELSGCISNESCRSSAVFILITTNSDMVPRVISSRCQKFFFPKLRDIDIMLKLTRIAALEGIRIEREALKLVTTKAQGSLREAENILDQLTLLGQRITSSMTQQLVGLVPHDKLSDLLTVALSGDTMQTMRFAKQLIGTGIEPQAFISQLVSHITDILSSGADAVLESSSSAHLSTDKACLQHGLQFTNEGLCCALQILVALEKQAMSSTDQTSKILAALLQIASIDASNKRSSRTALSPGNQSNAELQWHNLTHTHRSCCTIHNAISNTVELQDMDNTKHKYNIKSIGKNTRCRGKAIDGETHLACISEMEEIWLNMLGSIQSTYMKDFLHHQVKLASLTITSANAILHLTFKTPEDKQTAQMSEEKIAKTLENAIGCPIILNMSLEAVEMKISEENLATTYKTQLMESSPFNQHGNTFLPEFVYEADLGAAMHHTAQQKPISSVNEHVRVYNGDGCKTIAPPQQLLPSAESLGQEMQLDASADLITNSLTPLTDTTHIMRTQKSKNKRLSLSSLQENDASIEPYSQDILFDNAKTEKKRGTRESQKLQKGYLKVKEDHHFEDDRRTGLYCTWSCKEMQKSQVRNREA